MLGSFHVHTGIDDRSRSFCGDQFLSICVYVLMGGVHVWLHMALAGEYIEQVPPTDPSLS